MAYYSNPPPGSHFYENKPSAYDYPTPTPGYATYGYKRNDATSPSLPEPDMLLQPDTRPISHEQLVVEVKGIYAGLVMAEAKCIDIDERQLAAVQKKVSEISQRAFHTVPSPRPRPLPSPRRPSLTSMPTTQGRSLLKAKQGLIGFANGFSIAAMADTGSRTNVISASYAKKLDLRVEGLPSTFEIGNSRKIQSVGK